VKEQWLPKQNTIYCLILPGNQWSNVKAEGFATIQCNVFLLFFLEKKKKKEKKRRRRKKKKLIRDKPLTVGYKQREAHFVSEYCYGHS